MAQWDLFRKKTVSSPLLLGAQEPSNIKERDDQVDFSTPWPRPLKELLINRGFSTDEEVNHFFSPSIQNLKDPNSLMGMNQACERLKLALEKNEKICIYADFDLDGTSGCALLDKALKMLGYKNLMVYQPRRLTDGYGFHAHVVEDLKKQNVDLILTCDVGITAFKACEMALKMKIDVIITDHHLPAGELPQALVVINPNQTGDSSGLGYLSGAGVAFTLMRGLKRLLTDHHLGTPEKLNLKELLDCFTIATLTDMVPLIEDNRSLVQMGLKSLAQTKRPGLLALLSALNLSDKQLTSADVAIRFAPKLNALSRLEGEVLPLDLYLVEDYAKALELVGKALIQNQERVNLQAEALKEALEKAQMQTTQAFVFVYSENFHRGVIGLIATSLAQATGKPAFVASLDPEEGKMVGSCRLPDSSDNSLVEALTSIGTELLRYGGHARAAGFELAKVQVDNVMMGLEKYFLTQTLNQKKTYYDATLTFKEFDFDLMSWFEKMEPFGVGFERPHFLISKVELVKLLTLKGGHLKLTLRQEGQDRESVLFGPTSQQKEILQNLPAGELLDVMAELQVNEWKGRKSLQLLLEDVRRSQ
jgi:single-stranded-DNA-specific exonuclease